MADDRHSDDWLGYEPSEAEERARKQARVRGMTDPLGSMGFRDTPRRYRREARARRSVFGGAAASFVVGTALIIAANERGADSAPSTPVVTASANQTVSGQGAVVPQSEPTTLNQAGNAAPDPAETGETGEGIVTGVANGAGDGTGIGDVGAGSGLSDGETAELQLQPRPSQGNTITIVSNRDDEGDDGRDDDEHEDDDEHDSSARPSSSIQSQANSGSSSSQSGSGQTEIVISAPEPHTQTGSTSD